MIRNIIKIDENKCVGCGLCANACHEGAIQIIDGKARLMRDDYCDGLGNCLSECPVDAISFEKREALEYNESVAPKRQNLKPKDEKGDSALKTWPLQLKLVYEKAEFLNGCDLLIAADCTAFSYRNFHNEFMEGKVTLIGCPKLDENYSDKLATIFKENDIKSVEIVKMEVPCCTGILLAVKEGLRKSEKIIRWNDTTITLDGRLITH